MFDEKIKPTQDCFEAAWEFAEGAGFLISVPWDEQKAFKEFSLSAVSVANAGC